MTAPAVNAVPSPPFWWPVPQGLPINWFLANSVLGTIPGAGFGWWVANILSSSGKQWIGTRYRFYRISFLAGPFFRHCRAFVRWDNGGFPFLVKNFGVLDWHGRSRCY